jgi:hypothetical protein
MKNFSATTSMGEEVMKKVSAAMLNLFHIISKCRRVCNGYHIGINKVTKNL